MGINIIELKNPLEIKITKNDNDRKGFMYIVISDKKT